MADQLVNLSTLPPRHELVDHPNGPVRIVRALAADTRRVLGFVETNIVEHWSAENPDSWLGETSAALAHHPPTCFIAIQRSTVVGFACYDATAKGYFGPTGVLTTHQGTGIGRALLLTALHAMRDDGYGYAIIGWPARTAVGFYQHTVNAWTIPDAGRGIYQRLIHP